MNICFCVKACLGFTAAMGVRRFISIRKRFANFGYRGLFIISCLYAYWAKYMYLIIIQSNLVLCKRTLTFTSKSFAILLRVGKSGWLTLVHHFETVDGFLPNSSASHLLVRFFSTRTTLRRFNSSINQEMIFRRKDNEFLAEMTKTGYVVQHITP